MQGNLQLWARSWLCTRPGRPWGSCTGPDNPTTTSAGQAGLVLPRRAVQKRRAPWGGVVRMQSYTKSVPERIFQSPRQAAGAQQMALARRLEPGRAAGGSRPARDRPGCCQVSGVKMQAAETQGRGWGHGVPQFTPSSCTRAGQRMEVGSIQLTQSQDSCTSLLKPKPLWVCLGCGR